MAVLLYQAQQAVKAARLRGYDCRNITLYQRDGSNQVKVIQGDCSLIFSDGFTHYTGQPTRAIKAIGLELFQTA